MQRQLTFDRRGEQPIGTGTESFLALPSRSGIHNRTASLGNARSSRQPASGLHESEVGYKGTVVGARDRGVNEDVEEYEDDYVDESRPDEHSRSWIARALRWIHRVFFPDYTLFFMLFAQVGVCCLLLFIRASEGGTPLLSFFGLYLGLSFLLVTVFILLRVPIVGVLAAVLNTPKPFATVVSVLDPEVFHLAYTVTLTLFWDKVMIHVPPPEDNGEDFGYGPARIWYMILGITKLTVSASLNDRNVLRRTEYILIIWASRNLVMKIITFYFLLGFLQNVNVGLVKFLSLYSLIRKLNANWIRLTPIINELANPGSLLPAVEEDRLFPSYPEQRRTASIRMDAPQLSTTQLDAGAVEAPFEGLQGPTIQPTSSYIRQNTASDYAVQVVDELLATEQVAKERKGSHNAGRSQASGFRIPQLSVFNSHKKERLKQRYQVEFAGRVLPSVMLRKNIEATERSRIANLVAVNYVQNNPIILFVRGTRVHLHSKDFSQLAATRLFEELIEFRNNVAPDFPLTAEEMDMHVKHSVIHTAELQHVLSRQPSQLRPPMTARSDQLLSLTSETLRSAALDHTPRQHQHPRLRSSSSAQQHNETGTMYPFSPDVATGSFGASEMQPPDHGAQGRLPPSIPVPLVSTSSGSSHTRRSQAGLASGAASSAQGEASAFSFSAGHEVPAPTDHRAESAQHPLSVSSTDPLSPLYLPSSPLAVAAGHTPGPDTSEDPNVYEINISAPTINDFPVTSNHVALRDTVDEDAASRRPRRTQKESTHTAPAPPGTDADDRRTGQRADVLMSDGPAIPLRVPLRTELPTDRDYLTREIFELFLGDQIDEFMKFADPGGRDRVSMKEFTRMIVDLYQLRKRLLSLLYNQGVIQQVFRRMLAIFLSFLSMLVFLIVVGVSANTIIISGAASISSVTVALSYLYSGFIQSVMFVCFLNPYNVGDRVRLRNELLIVKRISTYFSEFVSVPYNKPSFWNHSTLYGMSIINESRSRNAGLEVPLVLAYETNLAKYEDLHQFVEKYVNEHAQFVKGSCFYIMNEVVVGHYVKFTYWITCTESWHRWKSVYTTRTCLWDAIARQCMILGIGYHLPVQPVSVSGRSLTLIKGSQEPPSHDRLHDGPGPTQESLLPQNKQDAVLGSAASTLLHRRNR